MKTSKALTGLIAISFILFSFAAERLSNTFDKNDLTDLNLKGKVKSITKIKFNATEKSGKILKGEVQSC